MMFKKSAKKLSSRAVLIIGLVLAFIFPGPVLKVHADDEYDSLREKWKDMLTGGTTYDIDNSNIAPKIAAITSTAQTYWDNMNKSVNRTYLWSDLGSTTESADVTQIYSRIKSMALAYCTRGSALEGNSTLLNDIRGALDWAYTNRYNENLTWYDNWWDWEIGAPKALNDIVVLLYSQLTLNQRTNFMNAVEHFTPTTLLRGDTISTGANRVWKCTVIAVRGIIVKSSTKIAYARDELSPAFDYVISGDGFYADGSFIQHVAIPYNGGYGTSLLSYVNDLMYLFNGSTWEVTDPDKANILKWVYDSFEPLIYKGAMMDMVRGREISRSGSGDHISGSNVIAAIIRGAQFAPSDDALAFKKMVKYWIQNDTYNNFYSKVGINTIVLAEAIINDVSIAPRNELISYNQFSNMGRVVSLQAGFAFGISMYSSRIHNFESTNNENLKGWHTADGMTYLYNGDLSQFSENFWPTVNSYRLPGTTVLKGTTSTPKRFSDRIWVGGTGLGQYGVTGMWLHSFEQNLFAKKSWFMFDDEIIALGSDIKSTDNIIVESIVENRKLNSNGNNGFTVNDIAKSTTLGWSETMTDTSWIHLEGNVTGSDIGYYFPETATIKGIREARTGKWSDINARASDFAQYTNNFMTLWFDHGANPTGASYSYVILPNKSVSQVRVYAYNSNITVLENSTDAQAVREDSLNIIGANFWNDTVKTVDIITSNRRASVMTKETSSDIEISVSDPTHLNAGGIDIEINKSATGLISADSGVVVAQYHPTIKFTVNVSGAQGKSFKVKFNLSGTPAPNPDPPPTPIPASLETIVDNTSAGFAIDTAWETSTGTSGYHGINYAMDGTSTADPTKWAMWTPYIGEPGIYRIYMKWGAHSNRPDAAPLEIKYDGGTDTSRTVNQQINGGVWNYIGDYKLSAGTSNYVKILASDSGYTIADAVRLVRLIVGECEDLTTITSTGDTHSDVVDSSASNGKWNKLAGNGANDYVQYELNIPESGTYNIRIRAKKNNTRGKFKLYLPQTGDYVGSEEDQYASADEYVEYTLGNYTFTTSGAKQFRLVVTGKNASSIGYTLGNDYIKLTKQPE